MFLTVLALHKNVIENIVIWNIQIHNVLQYVIFDRQFFENGNSLNVKNCLECIYFCILLSSYIFTASLTLY